MLISFKSQSLKWIGAKKGKGLSQKHLTKKKKKKRKETKEKKNNGKKQNKETKNNEKCIKWVLPAPTTKN